MQHGIWTPNQGTLSSYFNLSNNSGIIICSGASIPIRGYGSTELSSPHSPLALNNLLNSCSQTYQRFSVHS